MQCEPARFGRVHRARRPLLLQAAVLSVAAGYLPAATISARATAAALPETSPPPSSSGHVHKQAARPAAETSSTSYADLELIARVYSLECLETVIQGVIIEFSLVSETC